MLRMVILKNKKQKNRNLSGSLSKMLILFIAFLIIYSCSEGKPQSNNNSNTEADTEDTSEQSVNTIEVFGNVNILKYRNISLDFPARIEKIHIVAGQLIRTNEPILSINIDEYYNQIRLKEHELVIEELKLLSLEQEYGEENQEVNTKYMTLRNSINLAEKEIEQLSFDYSDKNGLLKNNSDPEIQRLENDIEQAHQEYDKADEELKRKTILFEESAISEQEYNEYVYNFKQKELAVQNLEYLLESTLLSKNRELEQIDLQIEQKKATLDDLRLQIENLNNPEITQIEIQKESCSLIKDEIAYLYDKLNKDYLFNDEILSDVEYGIIAEIMCTEGEIIDSGYNLISIIDLNSLYVEANVPEEFIKDIKLGNDAYVIPLADQDKKYTGNVTYIGSMAVESRGETIVPVHIKVNDNDGFLIPNFNVDIEIIPDE